MALPLPLFLDAEHGGLDESEKLFGKVYYHSKTRYGKWVLTQKKPRTFGRLAIFFLGYACLFLLAAKKRNEEF